MCFILPYTITLNLRIIQNSPIQNIPKTVKQNVQSKPLKPKPMNQFSLNSSVTYIFNMTSESRIAPLNNRILYNVMCALLNLLEKQGFDFHILTLHKGANGIQSQEIQLLENHLQHPNTLNINPISNSNHMISTSIQTYQH